MSTATEYKSPDISSIFPLQFIARETENLYISNTNTIHWFLQTIYYGPPSFANWSDLCCTPDLNRPLLSTLILYTPTRIQWMITKQTKNMHSTISQLRSFKIDSRTLQRNGTLMRSSPGKAVFFFFISLSSAMIVFTLSVFLIFHSQLK